jgi:4-aminobutyrate aminotransferase / (S)-3-amino-2-methylpropionate transaminase / 5-aminovalerate transaminase
MAKPFSLDPVEVPLLETRYRRIVSPLPHPDSVPILEKIRSREPRASECQPPILWDCAEDVCVFDKFGNKWLDFTSGVLVTNAGHNAPEVQRAIIETAQQGLLHSFAFANEKRGELADYLTNLAPDGLDKVFLLSTGAEAIEFAIKCCRAHGVKVGGERKVAMIGFDRGFHGRTLGAQQVGGIPGQKDWIVTRDPKMFTAPFPDGFWQEDTRFETFENTVSEQGLKPDDIAGVVMESFQGGGPDFAPEEYVKKLRAWCDEHKVLLVFDEIQAGCGRSGKFWAFEHYGVTPDLITAGKGVSSSLPLSGVIGRADVLDLFDTGSLVSTHSGNPICAAAALANLKKIIETKLTENAATLEPVLAETLGVLKTKHPKHIGRVSHRGLVGGIQFLFPDKKEPNPDLAHRVTELCFQRGVLFFAPAGAWGQTLKLCPPLTITDDGLREGLEVLALSVDDAIKESSPTEP